MSIFGRFKKPEPEPIQLSEQLGQRVDQLVANGDVVGAVKAVRTHTGVGLVVAKRAVDARMQSPRESQ